MYNRIPCFTALCFAMAISASPALAIEKDLDGWELAQRVRLTGSTNVSFCKTAVRIVVPKSGLVVTAAAPWKVAYFFCKETNKIYKVPFERITNPYNKLMSFSSANELAAIKVVLKGPARFLGRPCLSYVEPPGLGQKLAALHKKGEVDSRVPLKLEYIVSDDFKVDPHIGWFVARFCALPQTNSVPLQLKYTTVNNQKAVEIETYQCKKVKLNPSDFEPPHGLKAVSDSCNVLVPDSSDGALEMMMGHSKLK
ncbi:hypothetical protein KBI23_07125 [bacterium]|nr:hypothetical protein [bacterium]MBP9809825.1 hypothetical protein [bacterium]